MQNAQHDKGTQKTTAESKPTEAEQVQEPAESKPTVADSKQSATNLKATASSQMQNGSIDPMLLTTGNDGNGGDGGIGGNAGIGGTIHFPARGENTSDTFSSHVAADLIEEIGLGSIMVSKPF